MDAMSRPLRLQFPGGVYHVTARGNDRRPIFEDDDDCARFLIVLASTVARYRVLCHAYCLMGNHYHLLLQTPEANLSVAMRQLNGVYTQRFNRRHERCGHVLQGRFGAQLVDGEAYLREVCRYIVLNPVRAGPGRRIPRDWRWSSFRATAGEDAGRRVPLRGLDAAASAARGLRPSRLRRFMSFVEAGIGAARERRGSVQLEAGDERRLLEPATPGRAPPRRRCSAPSSRAPSASPRGHPLARHLRGRDLPGRPECPCGRRGSRPRLHDEGGRRFPRSATTSR